MILIRGRKQIKTALKIQKDRATIRRVQRSPPLILKADCR